MIRSMFGFYLRWIPLLVVILVVVEFVVTNELIGLGRRVAEFDAKIETIREENEMLRQSVASASSLLTLTEKARELGFSQIPSYIVIGQAEFAWAQPRSNSPASQ